MSVSTMYVVPEVV